MTALLALGCARGPSAPPAPTPPPLAEEPLSPTRSAEFVVGPIQQTVGGDGKVIFVEGTVRNIGTRPSRDLKVWVTGRDASGQAVTSAEALPVPQAIDPGATARYLVRLPNDPAIKSFHVEAVGR